MNERDEWAEGLRFVWESDYPSSESVVPPSSSERVLDLVNVTIPRPSRVPSFEHFLVPESDPFVAR